MIKGITAKGQQFLQHIWQINQSKIFYISVIIEDLQLQNLLLFVKIGVFKTVNFIFMFELIQKQINYPKTDSHLILSTFFFSLISLQAFAKLFHNTIIYLLFLRQNPQNPQFQYLIYIKLNTIHGLSKISQGPQSRSKDAGLKIKFADSKKRKPLLQPFFHHIQNWQGMWRIIFYLVIGVAVVLFKEVYEYQTNPYFQNIRKGSISDLIIYGVPFMIVFTIFQHWLHRFDQWFLFNYINEAKYPDLQKRKSRCYTFTKWAYSEFYYLPMSIWAYLLLLQTSIMPPWLGGKGNCIVSHHRYVIQFNEATDSMKYYYIIQFGKHLSRFFSHVFIRSQGSFYEYALHHGLSTYLILYSFLSNLWLMGIMVLMFHDITDFALILSRGYRDYKKKNQYVFKIFVFMTVPAWLCGRILFFSYCCVYSSLQNLIHITYYQNLAQPIFKDILYWPRVKMVGAYMVGMMVALLGLQLYWTYYIFSNFLAIQITSKVKQADYS